MNRFPYCWELYVEGSAFAGGRADIDLAGMFLDDAVAYGEAQACAAAAGLRREKGIENAVNVFARDACAGIHDFDFDAAVVRAGTHFEQAAAGHGVAGVQEKIQEDLLQFVRRAANRGKSFAKVLNDLNLRGF